MSAWRASGLAIGVLVLVAGVLICLGTEPPVPDFPALHDGLVGAPARRFR